MSTGASPKEFGAIGDGVTDDTAAVNRCLAASRAVDFGGPQNVYLITGSLLVAQALPQVLTARGAVLRGGDLRLRNAAHRVGGIAFDGTGVVIESTAVQSRVSRCTFAGTPGPGVVVAAQHGRVQHCVFDRCGGTGATIAVTGADRTTVLGNRLLRCATGITTGGAQFAVTGNTIGCATPAAAGSRGIVIVNGRGGRIQDNTLTGFGDNNIDCRGSTGLTVTGNSTTGGLDGVFVGETSSAGITISGNNFQKPHTGVRVQSATTGALVIGVVIKGNTVADASEAGIVVSGSGTAQVTGITVADNDLHLGGSGTVGVQVVNAQCSRVAGNRVYRPRLSGVQLVDTDLVQVSGNFLQDAGYGAAAAAVVVHNGSRALVRDNIVYGGAHPAVAITHDTVEKRNGMTVSGTRWRALDYGRVVEDARGTQLYDNVDTNPPGGLVRIMPLGDSITGGNDDAADGAYRPALWQRLVAGGYQVDFVGSKVLGPPAPFDLDHEGHGGFTIAQIDEGVGLWFPSARPHVVLLHIGTNDMGVDITGVDTRLEHLLGSIAAAAPAAHVFVATIIPAASAPKQANILEYNEMVVDATARAGSRFHLVHLHEALNNTTDLADGLHPNATGYDKMAAVWYDALRSTAGVLG